MIRNGQEKQGGALSELLPDQSAQGSDRRPDDRLGDSMGPICEAVKTGCACEATFFQSKAMKNPFAIFIHSISLAARQKILS